MNTKHGHHLISTLVKHPSFPPFLIFIVLLVINIILQPNFFAPRSIRSNFMNFTPLVLTAMAQGIVILSGSLDLSLGSAISLVNCFAAFTLTDSNVPLILLTVFFLTVLISGLVNGYLIGKLQMPALITTFATSAVYLGLAMIILPVAGGYVPPGFHRFYRGSFFNLMPNSLIFLVIGLVLWLFISRTRIYRYIYAVGSSQNGAFASGISIWKTRLSAHVIASLFIFLAALCIIFMTSTGEYRTGQPFTLNSVAAVIIGGIALAGGRGHLLGAVLGAFILGILNNIIFFSGASSFLQVLVKGVIIVIALVVGALPLVIRQRKNRKLGLQ